MTDWWQYDFKLLLTLWFIGCVFDVVLVLKRLVQVLLGHQLLGVLGRCWNLLYKFPVQQKCCLNARSWTKLKQLYFDLFLSLFFNFFQFGFTWHDWYAAILFCLQFMLVLHSSLHCVPQQHFLLFLLLQFSTAIYISLWLKCLLFSS